MPDSDKHEAEVIGSQKWVRVFLGDRAVANSRNTRLLRGLGQIPIYYFPSADVHMEWLEAAGPGARPAAQGEGPWPEPPAGAQVYSVRVGDKVAENAAWQTPETESTHPELAGHLAFAWPAMDAWYEEDEQIRGHPHDPYHLIDVRASSRHVQVIIRGETVAETSRPVVVFEAGLPARYYVPKMDVQMELLQLTEKVTHCAYKGQAAHYSLQRDGQTIENIAWSYPFPNYQYAPIQNLIAFYQERIADFLVDGEHPASYSGRSSDRADPAARPGGKR
jgi:uncharacterized protein (DUF427 family)